MNYQYVTTTDGREFLCQGVIQPRADRYTLQNALELFEDEAAANARESDEEWDDEEDEDDGAQEARVQSPGRQRQQEIQAIAQAYYKAGTNDELKNVTLKEDLVNDLDADQQHAQAVGLTIAYIQARVELETKKRRNSGRDKFVDELFG